MNEDLDRLVKREATLTPIVILFSPLEISRETEPNADELFDKCGDFDGVITDHCSVSDWRGPEVNFEENKKDFSCS